MTDPTYDVKSSLILSELVDLKIGSELYHYIKSLSNYISPKNFNYNSSHSHLFIITSKGGLIKKKPKVDEMIATAAIINHLSGLALELSIALKATLDNVDLISILVNSPTEYSIMFRKGTFSKTYKRNDIRGRGIDTFGDLWGFFSTEFERYATTGRMF